MAQALERLGLARGAELAGGLGVRYAGAVAAELPEGYAAALVAAVGEEAFGNLRSAVAARAAAAPKAGWLPRPSERWGRRPSIDCG